MSVPTPSASEHPHGDHAPGGDHSSPGSEHRLRRARRRGPGPLPTPARRDRRPSPTPDTRPTRTPRPEPAGRPERDLAAGDWQISDLVAAGVLDTVPGDPPVPVSVWRATGPDDPPASPGQIFTGLTTRLAQMLLAIWTDPGEMVIDTTDDPAVQAAADAGARTYLTLHLPTTRQQGADLRGKAALILLRWPPTSPPPEHRPEPAQDTPHDQSTVSAMEDRRPGSPAPIAGLVLAACRDLLCPDGHTVVILAPPAGGRLYRDYAREVVPAARQAGLGYLQHLVVISSHPQPTAPGTDWLAHPRAHIDLLVFVLRATSPSTGGRA
jgi:hypothetical protein